MMKTKSVVLVLILLMAMQISFGEVLTQSNIYSVDTAMDMAVKESKVFETNRIDKIKLGRQIESIKNSVNSINSVGVLTFTDKKDQTDPLIDSMNNLSNSINVIADSEELQKAAIRDTVKNLYITIYKLDKQKASLELQIKLNEQLLALDRKNEKLGLLSKNELEKKYSSYNKVIRARDALVFNTNQLYSNLKELMGVDSSNYIILDYKFIDSVAVLPISRQSVASIASNNLKIENLKRNFERAKNYSIGIKDRYPIGSNEGKDADTDLLKVEQQLNAEIEKLPYSYEKALRQVLEQYEVYIQKEKDVDLKRMEYKTLSLKYRIGSASNVEFSIAKMALDNAEIEKVIAKIDYVSSISALEAVLKGTN